MKVLPPTTEPPDRPIERRHLPLRGVYQGYRDCLRWEFGFTCPYCLLHEADLTAGRGVEASPTSPMWIEHRFPRSEFPERAEDYQNLYYSCALCNRSRSNRPVDSGRARLLDPCADAWSPHFRVRGSRLEPGEPGDRDAVYTERAYDLNHALKTEMRAVRRQLHVRWLRVVRGVPARIQRLLDFWYRTNDESFREAAKDLYELLALGFSDLLRFACVPRDAPERCGCLDQTHHTLPAALAEQCVEIGPSG